MMMMTNIHNEPACMGYKFADVIKREVGNTAASE